MEKGSARSLPLLQSVEWWWFVCQPPNRAHARAVASAHNSNPEHQHQPPLLGQSLPAAFASHGGGLQPRRKRRGRWRGAVTQAEVPPLPPRRRSLVDPALSLLGDPRAALVGPASSGPPRAARDEARRPPRRPEEESRAHGVRSLGPSQAAKPCRCPQGAQHWQSSARTNGKMKPPQDKRLQPLLLKAAASLVSPTSGKQETELNQFSLMSEPESPHQKHFTLGKRGLSFASSRGSAKHLRQQGRLAAEAVEPGHRRDTEKPRASEGRRTSNPNREGATQAGAGGGEGVKAEDGPPGGGRRATAHCSLLSKSRICPWVASPLSRSWAS